MFSHLPQTLLLLIIAADAASVSQAEKCRHVVRILGRLSNLVDSYASDPDRINADGYFGLRVSRDLLAQDQVRLAMAVETACDRSLLEAVLAKQDRLLRRFESNLSEKSRYDVVTFARICQPLARLLGRLTGPHSSTFEVAAPPAPAVGEGLEDRSDTVRQLIEYDEPRGDACLLDALRPGAGCKVRGGCTYFARPLEQASGYFLTHQLLYKLIVALKACPKEANSLQDLYQATADIITPELVASCGKIFHEFKLIEGANWTRLAQDATSGQTVTGLRDLYMEQALLCGLIGVRDFYYKVSVDTVASWQNPELGCFKMHGSDNSKIDHVVTSGSRRLLRDVEMLGGCSAHSSGVAMGFYSNAIRFLLDV